MALFDASSFWTLKGTDSQDWKKMIIIDVDRSSFDVYLDLNQWYNLYREMGVRLMCLI